MEERLDKQMRFMREMDKMKRILRRTRIMDDSRFENDAEHSWHMAVMGAWMTEYAVGAVDPLKAVKMCLIHDVVEIDAGDTYAFDPEAQAGKVERERRRRSGFLDCSRRNRLRKCGHFGKSLRRAKHLRRNMRRRWTACRGC